MRPDGGPAWERLRAAILDDLARALDVQPLPPIDFEQETPWLALLAGLTSFADWVGSDEASFPYAPRRVVDVAYLTTARDRARAALTSLGHTGWTGASASRVWSFSDLFSPWQANDVQLAAEDLASRVPSPAMVLIEAPTGSGKTEAALVLAEAWIATYGLAGMYYALPTQATSNQMLGRLRAVLSRRYPTQRVNLHLLHGLADLEQGYRALAPASIGDGPADGVVADAWFRPRRRGLLAPFAVGTVDQALLAAVQSRHFFVRLFGLAGKVIVIDEVHAYDVFTSRLLDRLLAWLGTIGSPVILLSATLPVARRDDLFRAYGAAGPVLATAYPRLTWAGPGTPCDSLVLTADSFAREVVLRWVGDDLDRVAAQLVQEAPPYARVGWVLNTVARAQRAYAALLRAGATSAEVLLLHARFPIGDRLAREADALATFAKQSARTGRRFLVATQIVEQSLDLDWDYLVTDLAPLDLMVQRIGRLHRHERRDRPPPWERAICAWLGPDPSADAGEGLRDLGAVYDAHTLLRTWLQIRARATLRIPDDLDRLLDATYGAAEAAPPGLGPGLQALWASTASELSAATASAEREARRGLVPHPADPDGLAGLRFELSDDDDGRLPAALIARTRLIDETVTIACLARLDDRVALSDENPVPVDLASPPGPDDRTAIRRRTVAIASRRWLPTLRRLEVPAAWRRTRVLAQVRPVVFDAGLARIGERNLRLCPRLGLVLDDPNDEAMP